MQDFFYLCILFAVIVIFPAIGYSLGKEKGRPWDGVLFGLLLGPIGLIIVLLLPAREKLMKGAPLMKQPVSIGGAAEDPLVRWERQQQEARRAKQAQPLLQASAATAPASTFAAGHASLSAANQPPAQRLRRLEDLRSQGLISEEEYQQKRQEILAEL